MINTSKYSRALHVEQNRTRENKYKKRIYLLFTDLLAV